MMPTKAFILAAGYGKRLRPHTDKLPKPMLPVAGRSLLERTLDHLESSGVHDAVINTHYLADRITAALKDREKPRLTFSHEEDLLDTGGGIMKAIGHFGQDPFFVLSGDGLWSDDPDGPALKSLAAAWNPDIMDILILLQPVAAMKLTEGTGDYDLDPKTGKAIRSLGKTGAHMFTSMRINHPRIFEGAPAGAFSYLDLLDRAQQKGRLFGIVHDGDWHHVSTPADLAAVDAAYRAESKNAAAGKK